MRSIKINDDSSSAISAVLVERVYRFSVGGAWRGGAWTERYLREVRSGVARLRVDVKVTEI